MSFSEDSKSLSQKRFGKFARRYVTSEPHAKGTELDRLVEISQPQPDWFMLDVATGGGHTALKFAPLVKQVVASDITQEMLNAAQEFLASRCVDNVDFRLADAEALPFETETFDLVTCRIAPHHFSDCFCFIQEAARVLRTGGILLVQDHVSSEDDECARYADAFQRLRDPSHNRSYPESWWVDMFQKVGLEVEHTEQIIKTHAFLPWAERQECTSEVIQRLVGMVHEAPSVVVEWMQPQNFGTSEASFIDHHIIISGRK